MSSFLSYTSLFGPFKNAGRRDDCRLHSVHSFPAELGSGLRGTGPNSLTAQNIQTFNTAAFYVPLSIIVCSFLAFFFKVSISEKEHAKIVKELEAKLASA